MKSVILFFLLCCILLANACKPEILQSNGKASATRNGVSWEAKTSGWFLDGSDKFSARIFDVGIDKCPDKVLDFLNIPAELGRVELIGFSTSPGERFPLSYSGDHEQCDVVTEIYDLDESAPTNFLEITELNGRKIKGIFDLQFINVKDSTDVLRFKDGSFSSKLDKAE